MGTSHSSPPSSLAFAAVSAAFARSRSFLSLTKEYALMFPNRTVSGRERVERDRPLLYADDLTPQNGGSKNSPYRQVPRVEPDRCGCTLV